MATAKMHDGRAIVAYVDDKAIDSNGEEIPGAPKPKKDTDPSEQPGALGAPTPEERMGRAIATAIVDPKGTLGKKNASKGEGTSGQTSGDDALPTIKDLPDAVGKLKTVADVKAMAKRDDRATAGPIYDARIAELEA